MCRLPPLLTPLCAALAPPKAWEGRARVLYRQRVLEKELLHQDQPPGALLSACRKVPACRRCRRRRPGRTWPSCRSHPSHAGPRCSCGHRPGGAADPGAVPYSAEHYSLLLAPQDVRGCAFLQEHIGHYESLLPLPQSSAILPGKDGSLARKAFERIPQDTQVGWGACCCSCCGWPLLSWS